MDSLYLVIDRVSYLFLERTGKVIVYCRKMVIRNELVNLQVVII